MVCVFCFRLHSFTSNINIKLDASVDLDVVNSKLVHALKQLQVNRNRKEIELHLKVHDLKAEFDVNLSEFDAKQRAIITGAHIPTEVECKYEFADSREPSEFNEKGISHFWRTILHNVDVLDKLTSPADQQILKHLVDVRCVHLKDLRGFKLEFEYSKNKYFTNVVLTKEYYYSDKVDPFEPLQCEGLILDRTVGCKIEWKSERSCILKKATIKSKDKPDSEFKTEEKLVSFFNFFSPLTESFEALSPEDQGLMMADFCVGEMLSQKVIPRAVNYFTGEGLEDDDEYDEEVIPKSPSKGDRVD